MVLAAPAVVLGLVALLRLHNGWGGIDLSIWDQALWRASEGHPGVTTILGESLLADHFSPAVLLFVPLYRLAASPVWLVLAQVIAAWAAVARRRNPTPPLLLADPGADRLGSSALTACRLCRDRRPARQCAGVADSRWPRSSRRR